MDASPILFVDHARALGGAEHALLLLFDTIDHERFLPHLATRPGQLADAARARGVAVHDVPLARLRHVAAAPWRLARGAGGLMRIIRGEGIELVHANTIRASIYAAVAACFSRCPLVWHVHDILVDGPYAKAMCTLSAAVVAVSAAAAAPLPCQSKVTVTHNGVRLDDFSRNRIADAARLRAAWNVPREAILIGQVARLQRWKGQLDVIAAAATVCRDIPDLYFVIVGGDIFNDAPDYVEDLKQAVTRLGLSERIRFAGHVDDVPAVLAALDMVVHASTNEPFGRILIEAGAAGLPVVAYDSGAVSEIIVHEETGLLVPPSDPVALAAAMRRLAHDQELSRRLGSKALSRVAERFEVHQQTDAMARVFARVLSKSAVVTPTRTGVSSE